jgi:gliding motility-associated-like protein
MMSCAGVLHAQHIDTICAGMEPVWYVVDEQPGARYDWKAEGGTIIGSGDRSTVTVQWPPVQGLYKLSVTEFNRFGCAGEPVSYYVYVRRKAITVSAPTEACLYTTVKMSINGGMNFRWSNGDTQSATYVKIVSDTVITVIVKDTVCSLTIDTFQLPVKALYAPNAHIDSLKGDIYKGQTIEIKSGGEGDVKSKWVVDKGLIRSRDAGGVRINFTDTGKAHVKLVVTNDFGCKDSAEREVHVKGEQVYMPTAFTPNGDGLNDLFRPYGAGIKSWHLEIYNRWGELIFSGNESGDGWDGSFKNIPVPDDGYVYSCEGFGYSGKRFALKGTITILR